MLNKTKYILIKKFNINKNILYIIYNNKIFYNIIYIQNDCGKNRQ